MVGERLLSREEVAGRLGIDPSTVSLWVSKDHFPTPMRLGKSARTDRWPESVVAAWLVRRKGGAPAPELEKSFFTLAELAPELNVSVKKLFEVLRLAGLLQGGGGIEHNRPVLQYMEYGWFWRIEKYSFRDRSPYFQTVVTSHGREGVLAVARTVLEQIG